MPSADADDAMPAPAPTLQTRAVISHVIFDMDGLLLDTEGFYTTVQEKILARYGKVFDWSVKAKMMGKTTAESTRILFEEFGLAGLLTPEQFLEERETMLKKLLPTCVAMPGVQRLIHLLHTNGVPIAVATGTHKHHFALKTQNHQDIFSLMHHIVTGDDPEVKAGKPSPDIFLAALRRFEVLKRPYRNKATSCLNAAPCHPAFSPNAIVLSQGNVEPSNCLVFEDAPLGVAAAKTSGMHVVMVPDSRLDVSHYKGADQVPTSLLEFNPSEWGLPPFMD